MAFSRLDLSIVIVYLVAVTLFGAHFQKSQRTLHDYFLGGRRLPWWAIAFSVVSAETSILTIISTPGHTPGHQSLVVESEDGPVALVGQAIYLRDEYEDIVRGGTAYGGGVDAEKTLASARRIIKTRPRRVHFSHDRSVWVDDR